MKDNVQLMLKGGATVIRFSEVAKHYGVTLRTVWNWKYKGMPCRQIAGRWKVENIQAVDRWLEQKGK